jgi:bacteriocin-like protein
MTTQPENKDKAEHKVSKDKLSESELAKITGGLPSGEPKISDITITKPMDVSSPKLF